MALRDFVESGTPTPATVATVATVVGGSGRSVAGVATVAGVDAAASEARRQRVLAMLAERPAARYAIVTDEADPAYPGCMVLGIGIRQDDGTIATADLITPAERYDGCRLLELVEQHAGTAAGGRPC